MTTLDATVPLAAAAPPVPAHGVARFVGNKGEFWRLNLRGALLLMVTLGTYRFWLTTDIRRFLWSNTVLNDESFEYTGTARELLLGFLFAIAVLVPIYVALFAASLNLGVLGQLSSVIAFVLLAVLGQFAIYRARRYRLTRTIYRGVRFHQSGSGWRYAACALFWWTMILLTLGLAYPFAQSRLERFKMRHTFFGDLPGRFVGSGWRLFFRGLLMWLIVMGPLLASLWVLAVSVDWPAVVAAASKGAGSSTAAEIFAPLEAASPDFGAKLAIAIGALVWAMLAAMFLYPVFQAMVLRWWASGLRFGEVALTSRLRTGNVYGAYARFIGLSMAYSLAVGTVMGMVFGLVGVTLASADPQMKEIGAAAVGIVSYVIFMLGSSAIYQVTVRLALWRLIVESLDIAGIAALDRVKAQGQASSAFGEGLADALNVGGL
jgi:uncharacterized membrane protein YjgN (DUF898 family)